MTHELWRRFGRFFAINNPSGRQVAFNWRDRRLCIVKLGAGSGQII
jgi:hypothetical protein